MFIMSQVEPVRFPNDVLKIVWTFFVVSSFKTCLHFKCYIDQSFHFCCPLSIARYRLPVILCPLLIIRHLLPLIYCLLSIARYLLPVIYCPLFIAHLILLFLYSSLYIVSHTLAVTQHLSLKFSYVSHVVKCVLYLEFRLWYFTRITWCTEMYWIILDSFLKTKIKIRKTYVDLEFRPDHRYLLYFSHNCLHLELFISI